MPGTRGLASNGISCNIDFLKGIMRTRHLGHPPISLFSKLNEGSIRYI